MRDQFKTFIVLLVFGLICQNFGPLSKAAESLLVFTPLVVYIFLSSSLNLCIWSKKADSAPSGSHYGSVGVHPALAFFIEKFVLYIFFIVFALVISRISNNLLQLSALSAFLLCLYLLNARKKTSLNEHAIPLLITIFFAFVIFFYEYFPNCWHFVQLYARVFSSVCGFIFNTVLNLGPTSFGFFILVSFVIYHSVLFVLNRDRSVTRFCLALLYIYLAGIILIGANLLTMYFSHKLRFTIYRSDLYTQFFLFLILCPSTLFYKNINLNEVPILLVKKSYKFAAPSLVVFIAAIIFLVAPYFKDSSVEGKSIAFYKKGSLDWEVPRFGTYGQRSGGMFGLMPKHLSRLGAKSKMIDNITVSTLVNTDVLVMINLDKALVREELIVVWNFVKAGGGLLLLGDHTDLAGLMKNFNKILAPVNISFKFDSAMPGRYTWDNLMEERPHPMAVSFKREIGRSWWVGASIECAFPAEPVVMGKYCYSDWGYKNNAKNAFLGNRKFDYYEALNDHVLAAVTRYGDGKIMAVGDTSSFHNTTFMMTNKFVLNVFRYLSDKGQGHPVTLFHVLTAISIIVVICCAFLTFWNSPNLATPLSFIFVFSLAVLFSNCASKIKDTESVDFDKQQIAYIDYSHKGRFDLMSWEDDSIGGLRNNLMRNGYFPMLLRDLSLERLMRAKLLLLIAPTQPFSQKDTLILRRFVESGGKIILTVGWEESEASLPLLESFELGIDSAPLGWCEYEHKKIKIRFHEAWPVVFNENSDTEVICEPMGYPSVVAKKYGQGELIVIADSYFLLNQNLEGSKKYSTPNMFLLRELLLR